MRHRVAYNVRESMRQVRSVVTTTTYGSNYNEHVDVLVRYMYTHYPAPLYSAVSPR